MKPLPQLPEVIEEHRDLHWHREGASRVETPLGAEGFIEQVGFAGCLTDARWPGPSLYVAVCGRRDAIMPRRVQKDPESSLTWQLKDALVERGNVYYAKLARGKTMFLAPRMIPHFHAIWGRQQSGTTRRLSVNARAILRALRREWELGSADLRGEAGITNRRLFNRALDELQAAMIVIPSQVVYQPRLTYIWTLGVSRFPELLSRSIARRSALREIARCFLAGAGMTIPGDLARFTGLSRQEAGRANRELLADGFSTTPRTGVYRLADTEETPARD